MNNFYFIGMPGCGKSTIGKIVAQKLKLSFLDLDAYIEQTSGETIEELFKKGEEYFRTVETDCLQKTADMKKYIIATGGGIVLKKENTDIMNKNGTVIFIDASPQSILDKCELNGRPLLKDKTQIFNLYAQRIELYRKSADYTLENSGLLSSVCDKAIQIIQQNIKNK